MHHRQVLRAGGLGVIGMCLCANAYGATDRSQDTPHNEREKSVSVVGSQPSTGDDRTHAASGHNTHFDSPKITPWQQIRVGRGDSLSRIFQRADLGVSQWMALLKLKDKTQSLRTLQPGDQIDIRKTTDGRLAELRYPIDTLHTLMVNRQGHRLTAHIQKVPTETREFTASGDIGHSLSRSLARQDVPSGIARQLSAIYRYRHSLQRLHRGDHFAVVYQAEYIDGRRVALGSVIAASITTNHKNYKAFRARDTDGHFAYYDAAGQAYLPSFTRKPTAYTRISSPFNLHRMNPVLHVVQPHKGVDMAAPIGTPVHAAADGRIKYAGWARGYGRLVELNNFAGYSTRYAHMHKLAKGLHLGQKIHKGQTIGYVGESGHATGPHLHFEIRRHGVASNPLTVKLPGGQPLPASQLAMYTRRIQPLIAKLEPVPRTLVARNRLAPTGNSCTQDVSLNATLAIDPVGAARRHSKDSIFCVVREKPTDA